MAIFKRFRKYVSKARKGVRSAARTYLKAKRTKIGKMATKYASKRIGNLGFSSTNVAKSLSNIRKDMSAGLEWKTLDKNHNTVGSPNNALRYFYRIQSSSNQATESSTTTIGTTGYLVSQIDLPIKGTSESTYDGQKFMVKSIALKGGCALLATGDQALANGTIKVMIVKYTDAVDNNFNISELIDPDQNGEYSTVSRRNRNHFRDYEIIAQKKIRLAYGTNIKAPMNLFVKPDQLHRHEDGGALLHKVRYYVVIVASPDISTHVTTFDVNFQTRLRFIH